MYYRIGIMRTFLVCVFIISSIALILAQEDCQRGRKYSASHWEQKYDFGPLPIGGQIATAVESGLVTSDLPSGYRKNITRPMALQALCLLKGDEVNIFHQLPSDSTWYYLAGNALRVYQIDPTSRKITYEDIRTGQFALVKAGKWKAAKILGSSPGRYSLVLAINVPAVQPSDVAMPTREEMINLFPEHSKYITQLTP